MAVKNVGKNARLNNDPTLYRGRNINTLKNISGVAAGGAFTIKIPVGNRKHGTKLFCTAVNYTGGVGQTTKHLTGGGNDALTVTLTLSAGREPVTVAAVAAGNGYNVGDTFQVVDATGTGAVFTVATLTGGAGSGVATATYNAGTATASPVEPDFLMSTLQVAIGGTTPYQVDPIFYAMRRQACGLLSPLGECSVDYTDPRRNWLPNNDITSWDTVGADAMTITGRINGSAVKPNITGNEEFDYLRNSGTGANGQNFVFAQPFKLVQQTVNIAANGQTPINNLTVFGKLVRLWVKAANSGTISYLELWCDGQLRAEGNTSDLFKNYGVYDFLFDNKHGYAAANIGTSNTLKSLLNPFNYFDGAYISDFDGREQDALNILNKDNLILKLTNTGAAQAVTIYMECLPGGFA